jgi:hypothetical protein
MKDLKFICEEWRSIPEFSGYDVSSLGRVRSINRLCGNRPGITKGKLLKPFVNKRGYLEVNLYKNSKSTAKIIHRLVAQAFIPNDNNKPQVNHIDGNKLNNKVSNLEWMSNSENQKHAYSLGLQPSRAGESNNKATITDKDVTRLKLLYNSGKTTKEVSELIGVSLSIVRQIIYGKSWRSNTTPILKRDDRLKPITI